MRMTLFIVLYLIGAVGFITIGTPGLRILAESVSMYGKERE